MSRRYSYSKSEIAEILVFHGIGECDADVIAGAIHKLTDGELEDLYKSIEVIKVGVLL
jgi:hypothetical protein